MDNVYVPWCNEAYTMVQLPASASRYGTASLHVKVNTGAGGNVLPLHVFCLYPNPISPDGLPLTWECVSTWLTTYNRSCIPLYGAHHALSFGGQVWTSLWTGCHQSPISKKANGKLCLCLDPHDLNKAICHDHNKTPPVEEVGHEFAHSHNLQ